jgi:hypothetical protein
VPVATSVVQTALPFVVFAAFLAIFAIKGRRRGQTGRQYVEARNRETFTAPLKPGWWRIHVAWALTLWTVLFVASGFRLVLLAFLPLVVLWVPLWTLVIRRGYRRAG